MAVLDGQSPEPDNDQPAKSLDPNGHLSIEKLFTHTTFVKQLEGINLEQAKQLLAEMHMLYLGQQQFVANMAKAEFTALAAVYKPVVEARVKQKSGSVYRLLSWVQNFLVHRL